MDPETKNGNSPSLFSCLGEQSGTDWLKWFGVAAQGMPEFERALKFLDTSYLSLNCSLKSVHVFQVSDKKILQAVNRYIGHARCPSASSCEKLAFRTKVLQGFMSAVLDSLHHIHGDVIYQELPLNAVSLGLQKLFSVCEGADDRSGSLVNALRTLSREWLRFVDLYILDPQHKAHLIFAVSMEDRSGLIVKEWWWKALDNCDRNTVLSLIEKEISTMVLMQPSSTISWRSYDKRWRRTRLKSLLEYLNDPYLLSELLRCSAVDDFEAAAAILALRQAGRNREAIKQAEEWQRMLPRSSVLAEHLFQLYIEDGWDEEALALAKSHYDLDPNSMWIEYLDQMNFPKAKELVSLWKMDDALK